MMKRILEVVNGMNMGGIENFVMNVLRNIDTDKYKVDFLYTLKAETYFDQEILARGCHIYKVSGRSEGVLSHLKELNTFFKEHKGYDVVHIHYAFSSCFTVAMYARLYGVKNIIIHSHNTNAPHRILHNRRSLPHIPHRQSRPDSPHNGSPVHPLPESRS